MKKRFRFLATIFLAVLVLGLLLTGVSVLAQDEQVVASDDGALSVHLPAGWVFRSLGASAVYSTVLVFAQDSTVLDASITSFYTGGGVPPGDFGIVAVVDPGFWTLFSTYPEDALFTVLQNLTTNPAAPLTVNDQFQYSLGGLYNAAVMDASTPAINRRSYIGGFIAEDEMILFSLNVTPITDFDDERVLLEQIGDSIRVPAEEGALTAINALATPTQGQIANLPTRVLPTKTPVSAAPPTELPLQGTAVPPTVEAPEQTAEAAANLVLAIAKGGRLSLVLPSDWIVYDLAADQGVYAYGDIDVAGLSRLASVRPDLVTQPVPIAGIGGLVALYPMSNFGIDPDAVDLEPLMSQLLQNLQANGYEVVEPTTPLYVDPSEGIYVVVQGGEYGYIALEPFGDEIAYITATGIDEASFEANRFFLEGIVLSVSVPAFVPTPAATPLPGLGGLGGLQQPTAQATIEPTIAPTATPTAAGLGGLGGLQQPTVTPEVNATPEASPTEG